MSLDNVLSTIDAEIARLQQARALLAGTGAGTRGRRTTTAADAPKKRTRRRLSAEARKRIADAQRKRWAAQKKGAE